MEKNLVLEKIKKNKIVPVIKINSKENAIDMAKALINGGIDICEITLRTESALDCIKNIKNNVKEMCVGCGTVINLEQAKKAIEYGCDFVVSPGFNKEICEYCIKNDIPVFPGCSTCSEIMQALDCGIKILKFFPCEALGGIKTLKALSAPFSNVLFMPTGGITLDNISSYLSYPFVIACGGSFIANEKNIDNKEFDIITSKAKETVKIIDNIFNV